MQTAKYVAKYNQSDSNCRSRYGSRSRSCSGYAISGPRPGPVWHPNPWPTQVTCTCVISYNGHPPPVATTTTPLTPIPIPSLSPPSPDNTWVYLWPTCRGTWVLKCWPIPIPMSFTNSSFKFWWWGSSWTWAWQEWPAIKCNTWYWKYCWSHMCTRHNTLTECTLALEFKSLVWSGLFAFSWGNQTATGCGTFGFCSDHNRTNGNQLHAVAWSVATGCNWFLWRSVTHKNQYANQEPLVCTHQLPSCFVWNNRFLDHL